MKRNQVKNKESVKARPRFKESNYNYFLPVSDQEIIGYNFFYRTMLSFDKKEFSEVEKIIKGLNGKKVVASHQSLFDNLVKHNFIIKENFSEIDVFKFSYNKSLYNNVLVTILLPTLQCNFDCPYCFEYKKEVTLTRDLIEKYLSWVDRKLTGMSHFHITWFGGEPLLCFDMMKEITRRVLKICKRRSCGYSASITTNGYLLTPKVTRSLQRLRINNVHVTFDGSKPFHDRYRKLLDGSGSFERLVKNVESYCRLSKSHLPLGIRVNVTDENVNHMQDLFASFSDTVKRRSRIYFRWVWSNEASDYKVFASCDNKKNAFEILSELYTLANRNGFYIDNPVDEIGFNYCEVDFVNHFAIDPRGYVHLCGHTFKPEEAIGHIADEFSADSLSYYCRWININPFDDKKCLACKLLPVCKGGCRKRRFLGTNYCLEEKFAVDRYVINLYEKFKSANHKTSSPASRNGNRR